MATATSVVPTPNQQSETTSPPVRILRIATCPSMSGKSKLTYHIGCTAESEVMFRVYANTAAGFFSKEWVSLSAIWHLLSKVTDAKAITSSALRQIFNGKSINTPAFLFAALFNEGLVKPSTTTKRCFETADAKRFFADMKQHIAAGTDLTAKMQKAEDKQVKSKSVSNKAYREAQKKEAVAVIEQRDARGRGTELPGLASKAKTAASEKSAVPASKKATTKATTKVSAKAA